MEEQKLIRLAEPSFEDDEIERVAAVLRSGYLVQGKQVETFERQVADFLGVNEAVACANGTASLHLAFLAIDLKPGDEVILPDFSFPSAANMVERMGATAVPVDIDPKTFNLDPARVEEQITPKTRAIMPVHLFGLMADMAPLLKLGRRERIPVLEDAACALGATRPGPEGPVGVGHGSLLACISFHPRKIITTGEGGMVVTNDSELASRLRRLRNHGAHVEGGRYLFNEVGFNYRMTEMQGALGVGQMSRLADIIATRRSLAAHYDGLLEGARVTRPSVPEGYTHVYQAYVVLVPEKTPRDAVMAALRSKGVESTIGTYALHPQPYYRKRYELESGDFPGSRLALERGLALPLHHRMVPSDVERVVKALKEVLEA